MYLYIKKIYEKFSFFFLSMCVFVCVWGVTSQIGQPLTKWDFGAH